MSRPKIPHLAAAFVLAVLVFIGARSFMTDASASGSPWSFLSLGALVIVLLAPSSQQGSRMWVLSGLAVLSASLWAIAELMRA